MLLILFVGMREGGIEMMANCRRATSMKPQQGGGRKQRPLIHLEGETRSSSFGCAFDLCCFAPKRDVFSHLLGVEKKTHPIKGMKLPLTLIKLMKIKKGNIGTSDFSTPKVSTPVTSCIFKPFLSPELQTPT